MKSTKDEINQNVDILLSETIVTQLGGYFYYRLVLNLFDDLDDNNTELIRIEKEGTKTWNT